MKADKSIVMALSGLLLSCGALLADEIQNLQNTGYIDVHMHLAADRGGTRGRKPGPSQMEYGPAASTLISEMDKLGIKKTVVMPPPQTKDQKAKISYKGFLDVVNARQDRLAFAAGGDLLSPMIMAIAPSDVVPPMKQEFRERALRIIEDGAAAFGEMTALHFSFGKTHVFEQADTDHPLFLLLSDIAAEYGLPIDMHLEAVPEDQPTPSALLRQSPNNPKTVKATIPGFERLLAHNRGAKIVWQHVGWDNTGHMTTDLVRRLLRDHPNLYCAMKFVQKKYEPFQLGEGLMGEDMRIRPEWLELMTEFPDRFMIGADDFISAPGKRGAGPPSFVDTWAIIDQLPEALRSKVGHENAARVYRFKA